MSCGSHVRRDFKDRDCIADIVKDIIRAQRKAVEAEEDTCFTSCDRSIEDLLSPFEENRRRLRHNTIPFILFCKESCKPFIGSGVKRTRRHRDHRHFECVESPIFRAKTFVNDNCVRLELLKPIRDRHHRSHSSEDEKHDGKHHDHHGHHNHHDHHMHDRETVCDFFPDKRIRNFRATGICITVDLDCFCGISCLDPITPLRAKDFDDRD